MRDPDEHSVLRPNVLPTAPFSNRPPSPPYIHVPPVAPVSSSVVMSITPPASAVHTTGLSEADLRAVTRGGAAQTARERTHDWRYEARRAAQPVLDYLYLGPASVARDRAFLAREGITMVLAARDARFFAGAAASSLLLAEGVRRAVEPLGIATETIDVADGRELVAAFSVAVRRINAHLLGVYRAEVERARAEGREVSEEGEGLRRRGKVLVCCETGNDRSAAIVAAYLMAVYGLDTVRAVQFMLLKRFSVTLGDETKFFLQSYEDILRARGDVGSMAGHQSQGGAGVGGGIVAQSKRRIEETRDEPEDGQQDEVMGEMDDERYACRNFAPFVERDA
ncbi:hypothetical protein VTK56DRAFT_7516 [Thermocarpiscus australiensis]